MPPYETISIRQEGGVDWLTLMRPERMNALNYEMVQELRHYLTAVKDDPGVRIIVIKGSGRAYCAGLDLIDNAGSDDAAEFDVARGLRGQREIAEIFMMMRAIPQAIVSLVYGPACGGGFAMALASDIRIAGTSARMNAAFIRIGLSACDMGVSYFLPRLVGASLAAELMMTGDFITADRALATGLVSRVVPDDMLEEAARPLIDSMLKTSPLGLRLTKECLRMSIDAPSLEAAIAMEDRNQTLCAGSADFREGVAAFRERRPPNYALPPRRS